MPADRKMHTKITHHLLTCLKFFVKLKTENKLIRLKRRMIEVWFGIHQRVADQAIDQWRVCLIACFKSQRKAF